MEIDDEENVSYQKSTTCPHRMSNRLLEDLLTYSDVAEILPKRRKTLVNQSLRSKNLYDLTSEYLCLKSE
jgi:hypothetical protein